MVRSPFAPLGYGRGDESADTNMSAVARFCPIPSVVGRPVLFKAILNVFQTMGSATERRFLHTTSQSPTIQIPRRIQTPRSPPQSHTTIANCQLNDKYNIFHPGQTVIDLVSALVHGFVCLVNMCRASHRDHGPKSPCLKRIPEVACWESTFSRVRLQKALPQCKAISFLKRRKTVSSIISRTLNGVDRSPIPR